MTIVRIKILLYTHIRAHVFDSFFDSTDPKDSDILCFTDMHRESMFTLHPTGFCLYHGYGIRPHTCQKRKGKHMMLEWIFVCAGVFSGQSRCFPQFLQSPQDPAEEPGDGEAGGADCYTLCHPEGVPCCQIPRVSNRGRSWGVLSFHLIFKLNMDAAARIIMCDPS